MTKVGGRCPLGWKPEGRSKMFGPASLFPSDRPYFEKSRTNSRVDSIQFWSLGKMAQWLRTR